MNSINEYSLRLARKDEFDILNALKADASLRFGEAYQSRPLRYDIFSRDVDKGDVKLLVDSQDVPQGYTISFPIDGDLFLYHLFVKTSLGGKGLGQRLLADVLGRAASEKLRAVTLCTAQNIPWNAPYYRRHGFVILKDEEMPAYLLKFLNEDREHFTPQNFPLVLQRPDLLPRVAMERLVL